MEGWAPGAGPGSHKEPCSLQRIPTSRQGGLALFCPPPSSRSKSSWEAEDQPHVGAGSRTTLLMVPNSSLGWNAPFLQARGTTERGGYREDLLGAGPQNTTCGAEHSWSFQAALCSKYGLASRLEPAVQLPHDLSLWNPLLGLALSSCSVKRFS